MKKIGDCRVGSPAAKRLEIGDWEKGLLLFAICYLLFAGFAGCSGKSLYTPSPGVLPENIRKVAIENFKNSTVYYGMEDKLTMAITDEFIRDGRLAVVNSETADGILRGDIYRYVLEPLTYDDNHVVQEYKLWILINVTFIDRVKNEVIWQEKNLEGNYRYFVANLTEEEAREMIWEKLARTVLKRTIKGFGSVTGISEKKVPDQKIELNLP